MYIAFAIVALVVVVVAAIAAVITGATAAKLTAGIAAFALVVVTILASFAQISPRSVGVVTSFGKLQGSMQPGIHTKAPWAHVEEFPTYFQYLGYGKPADGDDHKNEVDVSDFTTKFEGGGAAQVTAVVQWSLDANKVGDMWTKYRTFEAIRTQLIENTVKTQLNAVIGTYRPEQAINGQFQLEIAQKAKDNLNGVYLTKNEGIIIDSINLTGVNPSPQTQDSIDKIVQATAQVQQAQANQARAKIDAQTAKIQQQEGSLTPGALQRKCYEVIAGWNVTIQGPMPATLNCASASSSTPVIVDNTTKP